MFGVRGTVTAEYHSEFGCWVMEWERRIAGKRFAFQLWFVRGAEEEFTGLSHLFVYNRSDESVRTRYLAWT